MPDSYPEPQFNVPYGSKDPDPSELSRIRNNRNKHSVIDKTARKDEVSIFIVETREQC